MSETNNNLDMSKLTNLADAKVLYDDLRGRVEGKVDKIPGKGLSTNDYTDEEKLKNANNASAISDLNRALSEVDNLTKDADVTGDIVTFEDGAEDVPLKLLKIGFEPVQDLHGYDHPWPGGGGKNLLPVTKPSTTQGGITYTVNADGSISVSGSNTTGARSYFSFSSIMLQPGTYILSLDDNSGNKIFCDFVFSVSGNKRTYSEMEVTITEEEKVTAWLNVENNVTITDTKTLHLMIRKSTESSTWQPYSNICPITGRTGVEVTRTGKNLHELPQFNSTINGVTFKTVGDSISVSGTATPNVYFNIYTHTGFWSNISDYPFLSKLIGKKVSIRGGTSDMRLTLAFRPKGSEQSISEIHDTGNGGSGIIPQGADTFCFMLRVISGVTINTISKPMIVAGDIPTVEEYEVGKAEIYPITFPSEAGMVYGGELIVNRDGTGELVVDRGCVTLSDGTHVTNMSTASITDIKGGKRVNLDVPAKWPGVGIAPDIKTNIGLTPISSGMINSNANYPDSVAMRDDNFLCLRYNGATTKEDFVAMLASQPIQIEYPLVSPITYTLTTEQVRTLLGLNHVWASDGDITQLTYYLNKPINTDVQELREQIVAVQNSLVAPVLSDMIADTALAANDFRIVRDTLYKITSAISSGGTLTPGTNCIATSIGEQLTALLNA